MIGSKAGNASRMLQVLVVGRGDECGDEIDAALEAATNVRYTVRHATALDSAVNAARARLPDMVCVDLAWEPGELRAFVSSVRALAPHVPFVGIHSPAASATAAAKDSLVEAVRSGFLDVIERPVSSTDLRRVMPQVLDAAHSRTAEGRVIVFHSTKGGVGKSTLSVNVACELARRRPDRVLLVDASLQLGVCAIALDLNPRTTLADAAREQSRLDETLLRELSAKHECSLRVLASPHDPIDAADVDEEALARVIAIGRRAFDFVVVDTLPTMDGTMLTVLDLADHIYLVNQGTVPDVIGAARLLRTLDELEIGPERRSVVLNHNLPRFGGALTAAEVGDRLDQDVDYEIPHDKKVLTGLNLGSPRILHATTRFGWGRAMRTLVDDVEALRGTASVKTEAPMETEAVEIAGDALRSEA